MLMGCGFKPKSFKVKCEHVYAGRNDGCGFKPKSFKVK